MRIAILLGRGIEGCGVTRFATELQSYLLNNNYKCESFAGLDKKWGRKNSQKTNIIEFNNDEINKIKNKLNEFDIVFYQSLPSKSNSEFYKNKFFDELVLNINKPLKIIFQNDHKIHSLNRNSMLWETVSEMDCAFTFGKGTVFNKKIKQLNINTPVKFFNNGHDFTKLTHLIKKEQTKKLSYLGRFATFKEPDRMIYLQPLLSKHNIICEARGIEKSIGAKTKFFSTDQKDLKSPEHSNIKYRNKSIVDEQDLNYLHVYGPYDRLPTLELLSNNMFGANFFNLKKEEYNNIIEYTTLEMINIGMIVVVDKQWAQNNYHIEGDSFYDLNCFIYNDRNDYNSTVNNIVELANNQELRSKKRRLAYNVAKSHCDVNIAFKDLINKAKQVNKYVAI
tara:strand:- start:2073 stop:3251 length:1179 start_codon:yes stop_codon:yes gene_type:complete